MAINEQKLNDMLVSINSEHALAKAEHIKVATSGITATNVRDALLEIKSGTSISEGIIPYALVVLDNITGDQNEERSDVYYYYHPTSGKIRYTNGSGQWVSGNVLDPSSGLIYLDRSTGKFYQFDETEGMTENVISVIDSLGHIKQSKATPVVVCNVTTVETGDDDESDNTFFDNLEAGDIYFNDGTLMYHVSSSQDVPIGAPSKNLLYFCTADSGLYVWDGIQFVSVRDLSSYATTSYVNSAVLNASSVVFEDSTASTSTSKALTAKQGKILRDNVDYLQSRLDALFAALASMAFIGDTGHSKSDLYKQGTSTLVGTLDWGTSEITSYNVSWLATHCTINGLLSGSASVNSGNTWSATVAAVSGYTLSANDITVTGTYGTKSLSGSTLSITNITSNISVTANAQQQQVTPTPVLNSPAAGTTITLDTLGESANTGSKSVAVEGDNLTAGVTLTTSDTNNYFSVYPDTLTASAVNAGTSVTVTCSANALPSGTHTGTLTISSSASTPEFQSRTVSLSATKSSATPAETPTLTVSPASLSWSATPNESLSSKTVTVTGAHLTDGVTVSASSGFSVSPTTISKSDAESGTTVTVEVTGTVSPGSSTSGSVTFSSTGADSKSVSLSVVRAASTTATVNFPSDYSHMVITMDSSNTPLTGSSISITTTSSAHVLYFAAASGYRFTTAPNVNGTTLTLENGKYKLTVAQGSEDTINVSATVVATYTVTLPTGANFTAALQDANGNALQSPVDAGSSIKVVFTPDSGYAISIGTVTMGGVTLAENTGYTFSNDVLSISSVTGSVSISATAGSEVIPVSFDLATDTKYCTVSDQLTGTTATLTITPSYGFGFDSSTYGGKIIIEESSDNGSTWTGVNSTDISISYGAVSTGGTRSDVTVTSNASTVQITNVSSSKKYKATIVAAILILKNCYRPYVSGDNYPVYRIAQSYITGGHRVCQMLGTLDMPSPKAGDKISVYPHLAKNAEGFTNAKYPCIWYYVSPRTSSTSKPSSNTSYDSFSSTNGVGSNVKEGSWSADKPYAYFDTTLGYSESGTTIEYGCSVLFTHGSTSTQDTLFLGPVESGDNSNVTPHIFLDDPFPNAG